MWKAVVDGRELRFRLTGINNQNFLMADDRTGSWWQQASGEAVQGPLRGRRLEPQPWEELTFGEFVDEHPRGLVLMPDPTHVAADSYAGADWEERMQRAPVVTEVDPADALAPRALVIGVVLEGSARAYPRDEVASAGVVLDELGGVPIALVAGGDGRSVRVLRRVVDDMPLDLFAVPDAEPVRLTDAQTGSTWDYSGRAIDGPLIGRTLELVPSMPDYWFDWKVYHPDTDVMVR